MNRITDEKLVEMIKNAFEAARNKSLLDEKGKIEPREGYFDSMRSQNWIRYLAEEFRTYFKEHTKQTNIVVFSKGFKDNRKVFNLNEFLFDIHVCETKAAKIQPKHANKELRYITRALWQVESEFAKDRREAFIDFSKLVVGNAPNKLFICPKTYDEHFIEDLKQIANCCKGNVFLAVLPTTDKWQHENDGKEISIYKLKCNKWISIK